MGVASMCSALVLAGALGCGNTPKGGTGGSATESSSSSSASSSSSSSASSSSSSSASSSSSSSSGTVAKCASLSFDGTTGDVSVAHITVTAFTLEAWIKPMEITGERAILTELVSVNKSFTNFELGIQNGIPYLFVPNGTAYVQVDETTALVPGTWYHLAGVYNGTTAWLTVNGVLSTQTVQSAYQQTDMPLYIGGRPSNSFFFSGEIAEVRISSTARYTQAFTPETVLTSDADTVALWPMNADTGTTVADTSGNGYVGTINGGVTWASDCP